MELKAKRQLERFVDTTTENFLNEYEIKSISYLLEQSCTATMFIEFKDDSVIVVEGDDNILAYIKKLV